MLERDFLRSENFRIFRLDTGRKLNLHSTFRIRPGRRFLNFLYTFNVRPVSRGLWIRTGFVLYYIIFFLTSEIEHCWVYVKGKNKRNYYPAEIYLFKVNDQNTKNNVSNPCKANNKDTRMTSRHHSGAFIIKFEHISKHCSGIYLFIYLFILYLCLTCIIKNVQYAKNKCETSPSHKHCEAN